MKSQPSLARHFESFFHQRLTKQRNATRATEQRTGMLFGCRSSSLQGKRARSPVLSL